MPFKSIADAYQRKGFSLDHEVKIKFFILLVSTDLIGLILLGSANWFDIANQLNQLPLEKQGEKICSISLLHSHTYLLSLSYLFFLFYIYFFQSLNLTFQSLSCSTVQSMLCTLRSVTI